MTRRYIGPWWVYILVDPETRVPFYVGRTCNPLGRWKGHNSDWASSAKRRLNDLRKRRLKCVVRIMGVYVDKAEASSRELELIATHVDTIVNSIGTPRFSAAIAEGAKARRAKQKDAT